MDYFSILNLSKEPFSNSPDPDYFFQSRQHVGCLQKLELSLRLKRGLNVVIGDVGTGKTTLCRQLLRRFAKDENVATHLILDPYFSSPLEFLKTVAETLTGEQLPDNASDDWQIKEIIKKFLFQKGVDENNLVILIIDEGQKIPPFCLELLREFLNYETNEYKLLQIAIFAQKEFEQTLEEHANFADRINLYHQLEPMNFKDTRMMIQFRLAQSSASAKSIALFTYPALWAIYRATRGYPRKIVNLCHRCILAMIIQNRSKANWFLVRSSIHRAFASKPRSWRFALILYTVLAIVLAIQFLPSGVETLFSGLLTKSQTKELADANVPAPSHKIEIPATPTKNVQTAQASAALQEPVMQSDPEKPTVEANRSPEIQEQPVHRPETGVTESPAKDQALVAKVDQTVDLRNNHLDDMLPLFLGHIPVKRYETLGGMIQKVYGLYNNNYLDYITRVNPLIVNPNTIRVGELILFPAIPAKVKPLPVTVYWVAIDEKTTLEDAYNVLRALPPGVPSARLIPYWRQPEGLRFKVVLRRYFFDEKTALTQLNKLTTLLSDVGHIVSHWDDHSVFFANPY